MIVTLDVKVCSRYLGIDNAPHSLIGGAIMVTLDRRATPASVVGLRC